MRFVVGVLALYWVLASSLLRLRTRHRPSSPHAPLPPRARPPLPRRPPLRLSRPRLSRPRSRRLSRKPVIDPEEHDLIAQGNDQLRIGEKVFCRRRPNAGSTPR